MDAVTKFKKYLIYPIEVVSYGEKSFTKRMYIKNLYSQSNFVGRCLYAYTGSLRERHLAANAAFYVPIFMNFIDGTGVYKQTLRRMWRNHSIGHEIEELILNNYYRYTFNDDYYRLKRKAINKSVEPWFSTVISQSNNMSVSAEEEDGGISFNDFVLSRIG